MRLAVVSVTSGFSSARRARCPQAAQSQSQGHPHRGLGHRQSRLTGGTGNRSKPTSKRPRRGPRLHYITSAARSTALVGATLGLVWASWRSTFADFFKSPIPPASLGCRCPQPRLAWSPLRLLDVYIYIYCFRSGFGSALAGKLAALKLSQ